MFEVWKLLFEAHLILDIKTTIRLQKPHCKGFWWEVIWNKSCKFLLEQKEQKAMFLVVSRSDVHFGFDHSFFVCPNERESKIARLERNLSTPASVFKDSLFFRIADFVESLWSNYVYIPCHLSWCISSYYFLFNHCLLFLSAKVFLVVFFTWTTLNLTI